MRKGIFAILRRFIEGAIEKLAILGERGIGGAERIRTADLLHAMQALSQLSYRPTTFRFKTGYFLTDELASSTLMTTYMPC